MTRKRTARATNGRLDEALATLITNQTLLVGRAASADERFARMDERFGRMEADLAEIKSILLRHHRMLEALPEAVRDKIGFVKPR